METIDVVEGADSLPFFGGLEMFLSMDFLFAKSGDDHRLFLWLCKYAVACHCLIPDFF